MRSGRLGLRFWLLTAGALAGAGLTLALGFWQLSRADEKLALQSAIDTRQTLAVLDGGALTDLSAQGQIMHRRVVLRGHWLARHTVYLDNRQMGGRPGFFVLTPLQLEDSRMAVVVQRGWVARNFVDRTAVVAVPTPGEVVEIAGRVAPPPSKLYALGDAEPGDIRQNLDLTSFSREIGAPLLALSILQTGPDADGLSRDWPGVDTGVAKHYGYAFQWFALSGLIVFLYGWFQIVRRFIRAR